MKIRTVGVAMLAILMLSATAHADIDDWDDDFDPYEASYWKYARRPFTYARSLLHNAGYVVKDSFLVPAHKRLVIEAVSMQATHARELNLFRIVTYVNGVASFHHFPVFDQGSGVFVASQQIRLYADPGTRVELLVRRAVDSGTFNFHPTLSGYLLDLRSRSLAP